MIKHVVIFKFKKDAPIETIKEKIENLKNLIDEVVDIEVGIDIGFDKNPSDLCLITTLKDIEGLKIYATHPKHIEVINFIKPYVEERRVVDFHV